MNDSIFYYQYELSKAIPSLAPLTHNASKQSNDSLLFEANVPPHQFLSLNNSLFKCYPFNKPVYILHINQQSIHSIQPLQHHTILSYKNTDMAILIAFIFLAIIAWLKNSFPKYFNQFFSALYIYSESQRLYNEKNAVIEHLFTWLNIIFFLTGGLFFYLFSCEYGFVTNWPAIVVFLLGIALSMFIVTFRLIIMRITGFLFNITQFFREYSFQSSLITKAIGIYVMPLILIAFFLAQQFALIFLFFSLIIVLLFYLLAVYRGTKILFKNGLLFLYWILYLCSAEILPILLLYKYLDKTF